MQLLVHLGGEIMWVRRGVICILRRALFSTAHGLKKEIYSHALRELRSRWPGRQATKLRNCVAPQPNPNLRSYVAP